LECGALAPLWNYSSETYQSGAKAPHSKEPRVVYAFCAALWQTLLNFSFGPVVNRLGQGFGRL